MIYGVKKGKINHSLMWEADQEVSHYKSEHMSILPYYRKENYLLNDEIFLVY
jgi:hypothetical protein